MGVNSDAFSICLLSVSPNLKVKYHYCRPTNRGGEVCDDPGCNEIADEARIALQHMLLQSDNHGERLLLFPAWPKEHDIQFKLHAERNTTLVGELRGGTLRSLTVTPPERRKDVVVLPFR